MVVVVVVVVVVVWWWRLELNKLVKCENHVPFPTGYTQLQIPCGVLMGVDLFDFQLM